MDTDNIKIVGILIKQNFNNTIELQDTLSSYGNIIKTRFGINDPVNDKKVQGLIILEITGPEDEFKNFKEEINNYDSIEMKAMLF